MTFFFNGACTVRGGIPVRMLKITSQIVNAFDVKVIYAKPYSRTFYVNDGKFYSGPTSILNIEYASYKQG